MIQNSSSASRAQEPIPQWKRPAAVPQPLTKSGGPKKSILKRSVPWQMTVGAILLVVSLLFSVFN